MTLEEIAKKIIPIFKNFGVKYGGVFGSAARGEMRPDSDIDILVKFAGPATFASYLGLEESISRELGKDVDLVTEGGG